MIQWTRSSTRPKSRRGRNESSRYPYDEIEATASNGSALDMEIEDQRDRMRAVGAIGKAMKRRGLKAKFVNVMGPGALQVWAMRPERRPDGTDG